MPSAEIITIGTEILLGEIIDTNAPYLARKLRDAGIDLFRKTSVGDNPNRIALAIQQALERCDIILTTGGLGPTVDDPTRAAVAMAVGTELEFREDLWDQVQQRFVRFGRSATENNKRQAFIPYGAIPIENNVGTAPAFIVEKWAKVIISLPGVPHEMEYLMENSVLPYLRKHFQLTGIIKMRLLHTVGAGESQIDNLIGDFEYMSNPTVGLAAHSGQVDVRITAKADSEAEADQMILEIEHCLRQRLGDWIYGVDQDTLEEVVLNRFSQMSMTFTVIESGIGGSLVNRLSQASSARNEEQNKTFKGGQVVGQLPSPEELEKITERYRVDQNADCCLGTAVFYAGEKQDIYFVLSTRNENQSSNRSYGGPKEYALRYAVNLGLDILRRFGT